jgi:hypothetical protein
MDANNEAWICQCRRCNGVLNSADAVQYVWEWVFGACDVPVVVGVRALDTGRVFYANVYWHDEPDESGPFDEPEYVVSVRPGRGTIPTEGDVARWVKWESRTTPPRDWLLADGLRFRSVRDCVEALRHRSPIPEEDTIAGDWDGPPTNETDESRAEIRANWTETKRRNRRLRRA